jgi:hypothetical protein
VAAGAGAEDGAAAAGAAALGADPPPAPPAGAVDVGEAAGAAPPPTKPPPTAEPDDCRGGAACDGVEGRFNHMSRRMAADQATTITTIHPIHCDHGVRFVASFMPVYL